MTSLARSCLGILGMRLLVAVSAILWLWSCVLQDLVTAYSGDAEYDGEIRLADSERTNSSVVSGRLEVFLNGAWGTVCSDGFDFYEGDIACRQLGFLYADRVGTVGELGLRQGIGPIWLNKVDCEEQYKLFGSTALLQECNSASTSGSCLHDQDVALTCSNLPNPVRLVSQFGLNSNDFYHLISAGRLEIFINKKWGTVCDDNFDLEDAIVACRQMGFPQAVGFGSSRNLGYSKDLSKPIWLDDLSCSPPPQPPALSDANYNLRTCHHSRTGKHDCSHGEDIILSCLEAGSLRLVSNKKGLVLSASGRLEVYLENEWGTVCGDGFGIEEADDACKQLGFYGPRKYGTQILQLPMASPATNIWLDNVNCSSARILNISDCDHNGVGVHNCDHAQDVQLVCGSASQLRTDDYSPRRAAIAGTVIPLSAVLTVVGVIIFIVLVKDGRCLAKTRAIFQQRGPITGTCGHLTSDTAGSAVDASAVDQVDHPPSYEMSTAYSVPSQPPAYDQQAPQET